MNLCNEEEQKELEGEEKLGFHLLCLLLAACAAPPVLLGASRAGLCREGFVRILVGVREFM
jgi:hypothetical protein